MPQEFNRYETPDSPGRILDGVGGELSLNGSTSDWGSEMDWEAQSSPRDDLMDVDMTDLGSDMEWHTRTSLASDLNEEEIPDELNHFEEEEDQTDLFQEDLVSEDGLNEDSGRGGDSEDEEESNTSDYDGTGSDNDLSDNSDSDWESAPGTRQGRLELGEGQIGPSRHFPPFLPDGPVSPSHILLPDSPHGPRCTHCLIQENDRRPMPTRRFSEPSHRPPGFFNDSGGEREDYRQPYRYTASEPPEEPNPELLDLTPTNTLFNSRFTLSTFLSTTESITSAISFPHLDRTTVAQPSEAAARRALLYHREGSEEFNRSRRSGIRAPANLSRAVQRTHGLPPSELELIARAAVVTVERQGGLNHSRSRREAIVAAVMNTLESEQRGRQWAGNNDSEYHESGDEGNDWEDDGNEWEGEGNEWEDEGNMQEVRDQGRWRPRGTLEDDEISELRRVTWMVDEAYNRGI